jgi:hypothetical protein
VDGDGNDDVLVLARYGATYGQVGVFYGPVSGDYDMADADLEIEGIYPSHDSNDRHWVTQARLVGDITDGGGDDLLVAAQGDGAVYVFEGPVTGGSLDLDDADFYIDVSSTNYGNAGDEMVSLDLNDDGYEDLVVSAPGYDIYGNNYSSHTYNWGRVYVAYGPLSSNKTTFDADEGDLILTGEYERSTAGESLATGDFDADGVDELVVGAPTDTGGTWQIAVFQDHAGAAKKDLTDDAEHYWQGSGNYTGSDLGVGDQNGDGYDDLVIGARGANTAYIINGPLTGSSTTMTADVTISGPSGGTLGDAVDLAGDIDADGYADLIASSYKTSTYKGRTYFLAGPLTGTTSISSADGTWTGDSNYDYSGYWQRMTYAGDADGDGYDDVLVGATNVDESTTNAGAAWLISGGPNY